MTNTIGSPDASSGHGGQPSSELRLGYFPNLTHATAIVGIREGAFGRQLGGSVALRTSQFNAGPEAVEALLSDGLDAAFVGPNPAINAFSRSNGAIRIVSGATSGGAFLVVKPEIDGPDDLRGRTLATPQLGNTQDVALRSWLAEQGLQTDVRGGGDVMILPQPNAQSLETLRSGVIDGAWVPEPWASRLVIEAGGAVLVDEADLWPHGRYVTTHLIVRTAYLQSHEDVVKRLLRGLVEANRFVNDRPQDAQRIVNDGIAEIAGQPLSEEIVAAAWENLEFTYDPIASSLEESAERAQAFGLLEAVSLEGIYDLRLLNDVLAESGEEPVTEP